MCLNNSAEEFNKATQSIGDSVRFGRFELQILPSTRLIETGFPPLGMLFAIFYVSLCFQGRRAYAFYAGVDASNIKKPDPDPPKWLWYNIFQVIFYKIRRFFLPITVWVEITFITPFYNSLRCGVLRWICFPFYLFVWLPFDSTSKVEITRWLEYALTSPLQIWIVASLFFIGDVLHLFAAAGHNSASSWSARNVKLVPRQEVFLGRHCRCRRRCHRR